MQKGVSDRVRGTRWGLSAVLQRGPSHLRLMLSALWVRWSSVAPGKTLCPESVYVFWDSMGTSSCILPGVSKDAQFPSHASPSQDSFREESMRWISGCRGITMAAGSSFQEPKAVKLLARTHHITFLNEHQRNKHCSGHGSVERRRRLGWTVKGISGMSS